MGKLSSSSTEQNVLFDSVSRLFGMTTRREPDSPEWVEEFERNARSVYDNLRRLFEAAPPLNLQEIEFKRIRNWKRFFDQTEDGTVIPQTVTMEYLRLPNGTLGPDMCEVNAVRIDIPDGKPLWFTPSHKVFIE